MAELSLVAKRILAVTGLLIFGALNTLTSKILFTVKAPVGDGTVPKFFNKPCFVCFMMFVAMTLVILAHKYFQAREKRSTDDKMDPFLAKSDASDSEFRAFMMIGIPATCDLVATGVMLYGLTLMSASIYQMLRGSMIIFSALAYKFIMKKKTFCFHWCGVLCCVIGISCVGGSNVLNTSSGLASPGPKVSMFEAYLGIFLVIAAQLIQAAQVVAEEFLMKNVNLPPLQIVGYEGAWGTIQSILIMFPLVYILPGTDNGHLEDTKESFEMIPNSVDLQTLITLYLFSCSTFNITSVMVTKLFNAVHRTILEGTRTVVIWGFGLFVHYYVNPEADFGEAWLPYSYLELIGFFFLLGGQCIYGEVIKLPGLYYPKQSVAGMVSPPRSPS